jgi:hypothetical protein
MERRRSGVKKATLSVVKDELFEYRLEHDPRFLKRVEAARESIRAGRGTKLEDLED